MKSFITGSRIYGEPTSKSDIDLVVLVTEEDEEHLIANSNSGEYPIRYGKLNLITCFKEEEFNCWLEAKNRCLEKVKELSRQLTKYEAKEIHDKVADETGIPFNSTYANGE